ncbi:GDP-mannose 4,6-dehydratase [Azorhizobium oxalatiphilum]|uniref:GDP-mannose 4,6-dehydratase n=1 Tax=Azorhizobium oxalatiphilum TaxID=980631 RepID=A0A917F6N7_9HYPH|nr:GDP-mannose 4,6-dehydratase [Azorhizobium oxalatiphilum]GGF54227.1 GDP-mannose 4,6-dehydratase [Azorhizobium oxalatiphilum]
MKTALITGITGQDGAYLAQLLLHKGYKVYATYRRSSSSSFWRLHYLGLIGHERLELVEHDLLDPGSAVRLLEACRPSEVYNLAAQTFVGVSFEQPSLTSQVTGLAVLNMLEAIRIVDPDIRFYQASSAEMFGKAQEVPQTEDTPFYPRSPYGVAKLYAHWMTINYRESYNIFGGIGILFNHESPLRGDDFVTRKITSGVARLSLGDKEPLRLGNLSAYRDWGFAGDYVEGIWAILQADKPDTFVLATNVTTSVREFATKSFAAAGMGIEWHGEGAHERGTCAKTGRPLVVVDRRFYRPAEVDFLLGNPAKAGRILNWRPRTSLDDLCRMMVAADLNRASLSTAFSSAASSAAPEPERAIVHQLSAS